MTIFDIVFGVFGGNMLTVMVIYGAKKVEPYGNRKDIPVRYILMILMPVLLTTAALYSAKT